MEFAQAHPEIEVIGTDLSPIQPEFDPPLSFEKASGVPARYQGNRTRSYA